MTFNSGTPMEAGSNSSSMNRTTSSTFKTAESLKCSKVEILRVVESPSARRHTPSNRNGDLSMLTMLKNRRPQAYTLHTISISEEHSSSDPDCQCKEFSPLSTTETLLSRLMTEPIRINSGSLIQAPRPSSQLDRTPSPLISRTQEDLPMSKHGRPMPDGGNFSSMTMELL